MYQRIPVLIRAIVAGLIVQIVGIIPFMMLVQMNLETLPSIPWSVAVELLLLFLFVKYFRGWGWPGSTQDARRSYFRAHRIPAEARPMVILAAVLLGVTILLLVVLGNQIVSMPEEGIGIFTQLVGGPPLTALAVLATLALATGIVEEAAFRGYMQVPMEDRYGAVTAVLVVAIVFSVVHFPPWPILPLYLIGAIGWGLLARLANSTIPGMVAHGLVDFTFFMWIFADTESVIALLKSSILTAGPDPTFYAVVGLTLLSLVGTGVAMRRLASGNQ
jgi:membrane protease YdiL (CAAX protease family)